MDWAFTNEVVDSAKQTSKPQDENFEFVFTAEDFEDAVVMPSYRNIDQPQYFYVAEIRSDLTPISPFPSPELYKTFAEYYASKYGLAISNLEQPLLDVDHTSARLNLLIPRYMNQKGVPLPTSSAETKKARRENLQQKQILVPELCDVHVFPASLWRKAVCLPAILYRLNYLLLSEEIRKHVAVEASIGIADLPEGHRFPKLDFGVDTSPENLKLIAESMKEGSEDIDVVEMNTKTATEVADNGNEDDDSVWKEWETNEEISERVSSNTLAGDKVNENGHGVSDSETVTEIDKLDIDLKQTMQCNCDNENDTCDTKKEDTRSVKTIFRSNGFVGKHESKLKENGTEQLGNDILKCENELENRSQTNKNDGNVDVSVSQSVDIFSNVENFVVESEKYRSDGDEDLYPEPLISLDVDMDLSAYLGPSPCEILQALTMSNANDFFSLERLETIGDSFLKYAVTVYLYCSYPRIHEGKLSYLRSKQVSNYNLYRLGKRKGLAECMISTKFEPYENWLPPGYTVNEDRRKGPVPKVHISPELSLCRASSVLHSQTLDRRKVEKGTCETEVWNCAGKKQESQIENFQSELEEADQISRDKDEEFEQGDRFKSTQSYVAYNLQLHHCLPDKSIADCVEALIGCYLTSCDKIAALRFMSWMGLKVMSTPQGEIQHCPEVGQSLIYDINFYLYIN